MTTQTRQSRDLDSAVKEEVYRLTQPGPEGEILEWLEKMAAAAERRYILTSYPSIDTQTLPDKL